MRARSVLGILLSVLVLGEYGLVPHIKAGFYCGDPKISHIFKGDTVGMYTLLGSCFLAPLFVLWAVETCCIQPEDYPIPKAGRQRSLNGFKLALSWYWDFLAGALMVLLITDVAKLLVGEPRPHFLDTCRPDVAVNCTKGSYMPSFKCTNKQIGQWYVRDSTKSFPSGHTSLSVYTAVFLMWFIQRRVPNNITFLLIPWLHCLCLTWAMICSLTRITDHRHHWWDVLAGSVIGVIAAVFIVRGFCGGFLAEVCIARSPTRASKVLDGQNGHISNCNGGTRHQSVRRLLSSTSSYTSSSTPEERELRDVALQ